MVPRMATPRGTATDSVGVWGKVGVCGTSGVNGLTAGGRTTAGAAGAGAFPPPGTGEAVPVLAHPHMPQKLHLPGTQERHVGRPHSQLRGELRGEERGASIGAGCVVDANSAA